MVSRKKPKSFTIVIIIIILFLIILGVFIWGFLTDWGENYEQPNKYLWSKAFNKINNYNMKETEHISDKKKILDQINKCDNYIWIRNTSKNSDIKTDLDYFGDLLEHLKHPVILITSDGDRDVPSSYNTKLVNKILSSAKIIKWYTQNYDKSLIHPKLKFYPIGLDMHSRKWLNVNFFDMFQSTRILRDNKFNNYLKTRSISNKKNRIFCDSHLSVSHPRRKEMHQILKHNPMIDFLNDRTDQLGIMKKYSDYRFVLSPRGNGLDCHRTWEIFLLGSIVITEKSPLDEMYIKNNLPVVILNDFSDLNKMTYSDLETLWNKHKHKCTDHNIIEKFNPKYWIKK